MGQLQFNLFTSPLQTWNGDRAYFFQRAELDKQIDHLIYIQSGLGQSSQGHPEDYHHRTLLEHECDALKKSIAHALQIT
jgi:hypothetical protein